MDFKRIKEQINGLMPFFKKITLPDFHSAIDFLLNTIESFSHEIQKLKKENQNLKDEINRLKGEQGKPTIRPQKKDPNNNDHSSENDRKKRAPKKNKKPRESKKNKIQIDKQIVCRLDKETLPLDAIHKGYKKNIIQDIKFCSDNTEFVREVYYSPSLNKTFTAALPKGYKGKYGPTIKAMVLSLFHDSNMTQPAILSHLQAMKISISKATISRILTQGHDIFHNEKDAIVEAGLKAPYQQMDDTSGRINGKNHYVHILGNPFFTAYFTRPKKDRMTLLEILCQDELFFLFNDDTLRLLKDMELANKHYIALEKMRSPQAMTRKEAEDILALLFPNPKKNKSNRRKVLEAAALIYYQSLPHALKHLVCDDAPQFNKIALHQALCWIHEGRHYKKLRPYLDINQNRLDCFIEKFWDFYQELLEYKTSPTPTKAQILSEQFDTLFKEKTGYDDLDARILLTHQKKEALLKVLTFPFLPLHNNDSEGGAKFQAIYRDVHLQTKNETTTKVKDTFGTLVKTARKLNVDVFNYFKDRISGAFEMKSLSDLITEHIGSISA